MHGFANPARFLRIARWLTPALVLSGLLLSGAALAWGLTGLPAERLQGETVRIVLATSRPWLGMGGGARRLASLVGACVAPSAGSDRRPCRGRSRTVRRAVPRHRSIWGRPAWGTWWVWDGRLTSMLVLLFLYLGYIALAGACDREGVEPHPGDLGLVGAINIPIIHYSVIWWNSLHQPPSLSMGSSAMAAEFLVPLLAATLGFSLIFGGVVLARMRAILAQVQAEARLRRKALEA